MVRSKSKCRSCGAPIVWGVTSNGKRIPLDAEPEVRFVFQDADDPKKLGGAMKTYQSHFATCPDADDWRSSDG